MAREFPSFLDAYEDYAHDSFCPPQFHTWVGLSIIAAALERKVALKQASVFHVPNIYVMLVSHPSMGKSTALEQGTVLLEAMRKEFNPNFRIIPNQVTEPAFLDLMKITDFYNVGPVQLGQSAGYFYASEASSSALQNTCGDFIASLTAFYDCPRFFRKKLKGEQFPVEIENGCMNVLAGTTFDYLKTLVADDKIMGGFASRLIYVVAPERKVREARWDETDESPMRVQMRRGLVKDLHAINQLSGPFRPTPGYKDEVSRAQPEFDRYLISLGSPRQESIFARKMTNTIKLSMLLSVSEREDLVLEADHFIRAEKMIEEVSKDNFMILRESVIGDKFSQNAVSQAIAQTLKKAGGAMPVVALRSQIFGQGFPVQMLKDTFDYMLGINWLTLDGPIVRLGVNPDSHL